MSQTRFKKITNCLYRGFHKYTSLQVEMRIGGFRFMEENPIEVSQHKKC